jgi:hypothetical protein
MATGCSVQRVVYATNMQISLLLALLASLSTMFCVDVVMAIMGMDSRAVLAGPAMLMPVKFLPALKWL